jgi:putative ABC transport system substrate-binding protein
MSGGRGSRDAGCGRNSESAADVLTENVCGPGVTSSCNNWRMKTVLLLLLLFISSIQIAAAQQPKIYRIGYRSPTDPATDSIRSEAIRLALRELGYIEGQNIAFEYRFAQGKLHRLPELAAELVRIKVDVLVVAGGDPLIRAVNNVTQTIPIVMTGQGSDPVAAGLVESLARPGGKSPALLSFPES